MKGFCPRAGEWESFEISIENIMNLGFPRLIRGC
jgi:hypothetical protein